MLHPEKGFPIDQGQEKKGGITRREFLRKFWDYSKKAAVAYGALKLGAHLLPEEAFAGDLEDEQKDKVQKFVDGNVSYYQQDEVPGETIITVRSLIGEFLGTYADQGLPGPKDELRVNFNRAYPGCENAATYDRKENIMYLPTETLGRIQNPEEKASVIHEMQHFYNDVKDYAQYDLEDMARDHKTLNTEFQKLVAEMRAINPQDYTNKDEYMKAMESAIERARACGEKVKNFEFYVAIPRSRLARIRDEINAHQTEIKYLEAHRADFKSEEEYNKALEFARLRLEHYVGLKEGVEQAIKEKGGISEEDYENIKMEVYGGKSKYNKMFHAYKSKFGRPGRTKKDT